MSRPARTTGRRSDEDTPTSAPPHRPEFSDYTITDDNFGFNAAITLSRLMTVAEVADYCQVKEKTVRRWIAGGDLSAVKLARKWRIRPPDLEDFIRANAGDC